MINQTTRYVLRILGFLVAHRGSRVRAEEIAEATGLPPNYLSKILSQLRRRGIVDSVKGWGGGFELRDEACSLGIGEVLSALGGVDTFDERECVFGLAKCDADEPCPLHTYWARVQETLNEMLRVTTVKDLGQTQSLSESPLCGRHGRP